MRNCAENIFCGNLPAEVRRKLCKNCTKITYAAGAKLDLDFQHVFLMVEGNIVIKQYENLSTIVCPGDMFVPPCFWPRMSGIGAIRAISDNDFKNLLSNAHLFFITDAVCAHFDGDFIMDMFKEPCFAKAMYDNLLNFYAQMAFYQLMVFHGSAYDSVRYVLKFSKAYGLDRLTHAQIAALTGRNRSTVTQTMHEIALQEPELLM